jgi:hypothetical protein
LQLNRWSSRLAPSCLRSTGRIAYDGNEYVGDAWRAYITERLQLPAIHALEQQGAAAEDLTLLNRLELARRG